jgi:hypothetical protein
MKTEVEKICERYERREANSQVPKRGLFSYFDYYVQCERELKYLEIMTSFFGDCSNLKVIEIGAGTGGNLHFFLRAGVKAKNLYANELLENRGNILRENFPDCNIDIGDATTLDYREKFDIVFQSTVFTSILDDTFKKSLAHKMWQLKKERGVIIWYDFIYNNPYNKDVKGIGKKEILNIFPEAREVTFYRATLAPPIARRLGKFYNAFNALMPFLRTHIIAALK